MPISGQGWELLVERHGTHRHGGRARTCGAYRVFLDGIATDLQGMMCESLGPGDNQVEGNGKRFAEMHVDGGVGGQFFVAPPALMESTSDYKIPATALYIVINSGLRPDFEVVERTTPTILSQSVSMAIKTDLRDLLDRAYVAAKHSGVGFNVATIPPGFSAPSRGAFDPNYMKALFSVGYDQGKSGSPFAAEPPPFPGSSASIPNDPKPGGDK